MSVKQTGTEVIHLLAFEVFLQLPKTNLEYF